MHPRMAFVAPQVMVPDATGRWASGSGAERERLDADASVSAGAESSGDEACNAATDLRSRPRRVVGMEGMPADASRIRLGLGSRVVGASGTDCISDFDGALRSQFPAAPVIDELIPNRKTALAPKSDLETSVPTRVLGGINGSATAAQLAGRDSGRSVLAAFDSLERATSPTVRTFVRDRHGVVADGRPEAALRPRIRVNVCAVDCEFVADGDSGRTSSMVRRKWAAG